MRQRLILFLLGILALGWVIYSSFDLVLDERLSDFRYFFKPDDKIIYVVQDPSSLDWDNEGITTTELNQNLYYSIIKKLKEPCTLFFSANKTKFLIEKKGNWTQREIIQLFDNGMFPLQIGRLKKFEFGKLHGYYKKNQLILYQDELPIPKKNQLTLSSKASYAWFSWENHQIKLTETYRKKDGYYRYTKTIDKSNKFQKKDDRLIFGEIVPDFFDSYYFYDKSYALQKDKEFATSPWEQCIKSGFVHLKMDNSSLIIFDFKENANPIQTLNEFFQKEELNNETASFDNLKFSSLVSNLNTTWHIAVSGQYGFASPNKALLDQALGASRLGQTLSQNEQKTNRLFSQMPKKVSARFVEKGLKQTLSYLGNQLVKTNYTKYSNQVIDQNDDVRDYFVMNPGFRVLHFASFDQRGNTIVYTENMQLVGYQNGLRKWEKAIQGEVKEIYQIKSFPQLICVQLPNEAQLYDKNGKIIYKLTHQAGTKVQIFENKGKKEFICTNGANAVQLYNDNGALIKQFAINGLPKQMHCFYQASNSYLSILTDKQFQTIDLTKRRSVKTQNVDSTCVLVGNQTGAFVVKIDNSTATVISLNNQKQFKIPNSVSCLGSYLQSDNPMLLFKRNTSIFAFNLDGKRQWEKTLKATELSQFSHYKLPNKRSILAFLDAVGNQIYILDELGRDLETQKRHGQQEFQLSAFGQNAYSITTFLGTYLIQYNKQ